jgi:hypothetical protein
MNPLLPTEMSAPPSAPSTLPNPSTLLQASKLAMAEDKPIHLDYFTDTLTGKAYMGEDSETKEKTLVKSPEEFTSQIKKVYKVAEDFIVMTENSIYIVSGKINRRIIQPGFLSSD